MVKGRWKENKGSSQAQSLWVLGGKAVGTGSLGTQRVPGRRASPSRIWKHSRVSVEELSLEREGRLFWGMSPKHPRGCAPGTPGTAALPSLLTPSSRKPSLGPARLTGVVGRWARRSLRSSPAGWNAGRNGAGRARSCRFSPGRTAGAAPTTRSAAEVTLRPPFQGFNHAGGDKCVLMMKAAVPGQAFTEKKGCHSNYLGRLSGNLELFATLYRCWEWI